MPKSLRVGEVVKVNVAVYNSLKVAIDAKVVIEILETEDGLDLSDENVDKNEFVQIYKEMNVCKINALTEKSVQSKIMQIESDIGKSTHVFIRANLPGNLMLKVTASSQNQTDKIIETLNVEPHGRRSRQTKGFFVDLRKNQYTRRAFECEFSDETLSNSKKVHASVKGYVVGEAMTDIERLIKLPTGKL